MKSPESFDKSVDCANHPGVVSVGVCTVCGKPLCGSCAGETTGSLVFCTSEHRTFLNDWAAVYRCHSEFEADMIATNLGIQNVETKVFSSRSFKYDLGENLKDCVGIFVARSEMDRATTVLQTLGLLPTDETVHIH